MLKSFNKSKNGILAAPKSRKAEKRPQSQSLRGVEGEASRNGPAGEGISGYVKGVFQVEYLVVRQQPPVVQISLDNFLAGVPLPDEPDWVPNPTKTYELDSVSSRRVNGFDIGGAVEKLRRFNELNESLREKPREEFYRTFYIPKKTGGLRRIDAPNDELSNALRELRFILEQDFGLLAHTNAYAYIKDRSCRDLMVRHQKNESWWFAKFDVHGFFPSTTLNFVMSMAEKIFPLSRICAYPGGREELEKALELGFLNGGLPQGTPLSPTLTNIMMIPIDYRLCTSLRDFEKKNFVYTRYADDFVISCKYEFSASHVEKLINDTFAEFGAPFSLNAEKTRYGSRAGSNFSFGMILNKDNEITVGRKKKKQMESIMHAYLMDRKKGVMWSLEDLQVMRGQLEYCLSIERETFQRIISFENKKHGADLLKAISEDMRFWAKKSMI